MSFISEKVVYLDGLADGLSLKDEGTDKVLRGIIETLWRNCRGVGRAGREHRRSSDCIDGIYDELGRYRNRHRRRLRR